MKYFSHFSRIIGTCTDDTYPEKKRHLGTTTPWPIIIWNISPKKNPPKIILSEIRIFFLSRTQNQHSWTTPPVESQTTPGHLIYTLIGPNFSPTTPPFCFWNWMYRIVLAKKASDAGSGVVESLCISLAINSTSPWIAALVTCGFPFSKKYRYLKHVQRVHNYRIMPDDMWHRDQKFKITGSSCSLVQYFNKQCDRPTCTTYCIGHLLSCICNSQGTLEAKEDPAIREGIWSHTLKSSSHI